MKRTIDVAWVRLNAARQPLRMTCVSAQVVRVERGVLHGVIQSEAGHINVFHPALVRNLMPVSVLYICERPNDFVITKSHEKPEQERTNMKTRILKNNLFILTVGVTLAGLLAITQAGASNEGEGPFKLGGGWVGHASGLWTWTALQTPINPAATEAVLRVNFTSYGADLAGLAAAFGADSVSDLVGQEVMINRDTAQWTLVGYAQARGANNELQIRAIVVGFGTLQFIDPDHDVIHATITVYPASADADGDGMPDVGATPVITIPGITETGQRVSILQ
jgi:hypothetical protein